jgi:chromosome partitioning protein
MIVAGLEASARDAVIQVAEILGATEHRSERIWACVSEERRSQQRRSAAWAPQIRRGFPARPRRPRLTGPPGLGDLTQLRLDSAHLARTIAVAMQKGGVGKTTTAVNLGAALAEIGQRVLLIDLDAQGHLTLYMKPPAELEKTVYHLLVDPDTTVTDVVQEAAQMGVHYIPADVELAGAENQLINEIGRESILRDKLEAAQKRYDFIIIDCPPSLDLIVINALVAADEVLVPLQAEFLALKGMQELLITMERVKRRLNPRLELIGILPTLYKSRALHSQEVLAAVKEKYGDKVYDFGVTDSIRFAETPLAGMSILQYAKESDGAKAYRALAVKVMENHRL